MLEQSAFSGLHTPLEPDSLQFLHPLKGHVRCPAFREELVLSTLTFNPCRELWISRVRARDVAITVSSSILLELIQTVFPCRCMTIPNESNVLQQLDPLWCHRALFILAEKLVLVSLSLDPAGQADVLFVRVRNLTAAFDEVKQQEILLEKVSK